MSKFLKILAITAITIADAAASNNERNHAAAAENAEEQKWLRRMDDGLKLINAGLLRDHSSSYVSDQNKENTAMRLKTEIVDHCRRRSEALTRMTETAIAKFERTGL